MAERDEFDSWEEIRTFQLKAARLAQVRELKIKTVCFEAIFLQV